MLDILKSKLSLAALRDKLTWSFALAIAAICLSVAALFVPPLHVFALLFDIVAALVYFLE